MGAGNTKNAKRQDTDNVTMQLTKNIRVTAVTVTYNRTSTLEKCLDALLSQTRAVDEILVVDNNSNTEEKRRLYELIAKDERIHLTELPENSGGAGGFEAGMRAAKVSYPADWYWIMDDDAYPRADCLEKLLKAGEKINAKLAERDAKGSGRDKTKGRAKSLDKNKPSGTDKALDGDDTESGIRADKMNRIGFIAPLIYGIDLKEYQLYHHKYLRGRAFDSIPMAESYDELKAINKVDANAFVGPLISKEAVEAVGVADGSLFIYGDDTEYTYRVTRKMPGVMVKAAVIDHQDPPIVGGSFLEPKGWWKEYYSNRNRIFFITKYAANVYARLAGYVTMMYQILGLAAAAAIKPKYKGYHVLRVKLLLRSLFDGLMDRRGKNIDPGEYGKLINKNA